MKTKQKLLFLLPLLFLFTPLFSSAQFITTNAPCEPEIIPPLGQVEGVFCPYCVDKGDYVHLKWDLKTNFQDPVCGISCWQPNGDQCSSWFLERRLVDLSGRQKTNFKPKDDVFIEEPAAVRRDGPGINYQISCRERNDPNKHQLSSGIRIVSDCDAQNIGENCEIPFDEIAKQLNIDVWDRYSFSRVPITEIDLVRWANDSSTEDFSTSFGSGNVDDIISHMIQIQNRTYRPKDVSTINKDNKASCPIRRPLYFNSKISYGRYLDSTFLSQKLANYVNEYGYPLGVTVRNINWQVFERDKRILSPLRHKVIVVRLENNEDLTDGQSKDVFNLEILDPNIPDEITKLYDCKPASLYIESSGYQSLNEGGFGCRGDAYSYLGQEVFVYGKDQVVPSEVWLESYDSYRLRLCYPGSVQEKTDFCQRGRLTDWLKNNLTYLENPSDGGGNCYGWATFMLKVAYLGDFVGYDYHPNDGKIVGRDCDENRYPIGKSLKEIKTLKSSHLGSLNWLANAWMAWENLLKLK